MKTPQDLDKIYNKLPKEKTELSVNKVELGIADEITKKMAGAEKLIDAVKKNFDKVEAIEEAMIGELKSAIKKAEKKADPFYNASDKAEKYKITIADVLDKAEKAARELNVKPSSIKNYSKLDKLYNDFNKLPQDLDKIYNKLPQEKTELKSVKVKLSVMDDIEEFLGQGFGLQEFAQDAIDEAQVQTTKARDIIRFDMGDAITQAEGLINDAEQQLKELGADSPQLDGFKKQLADLEGIQKDLLRESDNI